MGGLRLRPRVLALAALGIACVSGCHLAHERPTDGAVPSVPGTIACGDDLCVVGAEHCVDCPGELCRSAECMAVACVGCAPSVHRQLCDPDAVHSDLWTPAAVCTGELGAMVQARVAYLGCDGDDDCTDPGDRCVVEVSSTTGEVSGASSCRVPRSTDVVRPTQDWSVVGAAACTAACRPLWSDGLAPAPCACPRG